MRKCRAVLLERMRAVLPERMCKWRAVLSEKLSQDQVNSDRFRKQRTTCGKGGLGKLCACREDVQG